jgi:quercetin dioxygenase-like cupin family protein
MKLFGRETGQSVTLFEQAVPAGSKNSWLHLHRDSDEIAWVLEGEFTFKIGDEVTTGGPGTCAFMPRNVPHAWKNSGSTPGRVVFLYTPAGAGKLSRGLGHRRQRPQKRLEKPAGKCSAPATLGVVRRCHPLALSAKVCRYFSKERQWPSNECAVPHVSAVVRQRSIWQG